MTTATTMTECKIESNVNNMTTAANQVVIGSAISMGGLVGVWGVACLISAVAQCGGVIEMARMYLGALGI